MRRHHGHAGIPLIAARGAPERGKVAMTIIVDELVAHRVGKFMATHLILSSV